MWLFVIWCVTLVTALVLYFRQVYSSFERRGVKTVGVIPPFGTMARVALGLEHLVDNVNKSYYAFPNEKFVGRYEFLNPVLVVRDLELIKKIAIKDFEHFLDHRLFITKDNDPLFGRNLFALQGQEWKDMRSTLSPAFTSSKMKHMLPFMVEVGDQMMLNLKKNIEESDTSYLDVDVKDLTTRFANDVIATCAFGLKVDSHTDRDNDFYAQGLVASTFKFKQLLLFFAYASVPKLMNKIKLTLFSEGTTSFFRNLVMDTMKDRERRNIIRPDMIHLLMEAKKGKLTHEDKTHDTDAGFATVEESAVGKKQINIVWSDDDLTAQAILFFIAGFETVSTGMSFLLYELAINPDVQDKLAHEIRDTDARNNGKFDYNSIQQMTYMDMVVSESLRKWPPALALDRLCTKDYNLGKVNDKATEDYIIRKGEGVQIPSWAIHRDPEYFPNPDKFDPERFSEKNKHNINSFAYMPFGLGPRNCIELLRMWLPFVAMDRVCSKDYKIGKVNDKATEEYITMWLTVIWCAALVAALWLYFHQAYSYFDPRGVKTRPVAPPFGTIAGVVLRKHHFVDNIKKDFYAFPGDRFIGKFEFMNPLLVIRDLELIKRITIKDFEHFLDHRALISKDNDPLFGRNLFSLTGQEWKDMRSTLSPAFTSSKMKLMVPFMVDVGDQMILNLKRKIKESGTSYLDVDVKDLTTRFANDVIASCAFGLKVDSHADRDNEFYTQGLIASTFKFKQLLLFFAYTSFPKIMNKINITMFSKNTCHFFRTLVMDTMRHREQRNVIRPDMIHLLMEAKKGKLTHENKTHDTDAGFATVEESAVGKKQNDRVWSDDDLTAQALLFFIAGFETASSAMSFLLYELAINPDVQEKLAQEIRETDAKNNGKFDYASIQQMTYMDMVVSELLRLWSPGIALDRVCIKDYNLGKVNDKATEDYIIRKGEGIQIPTWAIHRDPEYYPNPDKFDPERFSEENKHNIQPFAYMPFGLGPRNCIGSRFALWQVKILAYQLLLHLEMSPGPKTCIPAELEKDTFNIRIKGGHWIRFKTRT